MFQPNAAHFVGEGKEKVIAIERPGAEQLDRLIHQPLMRVQLLRLDDQVLGLIRNNVQCHTRRKWICTEMLACEYGTIDQSFIIDRFIGDRIASG